jgi:hypothetical protein
MRKSKAITNQRKLGDFARRIVEGLHIFHEGVFFVLNLIDSGLNIRQCLSQLTLIKLNNAIISNSVANHPFLEILNYLL